MKRLLCLTILMVAGCTSLDRTLISELEPLHEENGYKYFKYKAQADDLQYKLDERGEATRIKWLEQWLQTNSYNPSDYEIVSRDVVNAGQAFLNKSYHVVYRVRVPVVSTAN